MVGTSASAPHVAGAAALLIQRARAAGQPSDPDDDHGQLEASALDVGLAGPDNETGFGKLRLDLTPPVVRASLAGRGRDASAGIVHPRLQVIEDGTIDSETMRARRGQLLARGPRRAPDRHAAPAGRPARARRARRRHVRQRGHARAAVRRRQHAAHGHRRRPERRARADSSATGASVAGRPCATPGSAPATRSCAGSGGADVFPVVAAPAAGLRRRPCDPRPARSGRLHACRRSTPPATGRAPSPLRLPAR